MRIGPLELAAIVAVVVVLFILFSRNRHQRPANVELAELFGEPVTPQPGPKAMGWAYGVLHEAGVDPDGDPVYAIKTLREADRRLSLLAATAIINRMNAS